MSPKLSDTPELSDALDLSGTSLPHRHLTYTDLNQTLKNKNEWIQIRTPSLVYPLRGIK